MVRYLLEKTTATKISTGVYTWAFGTRNEHRPESVKIGPVTVSSETDIKHCVILSNSFTNDTKTHTLKGNSLQPVLAVVMPEHRMIRNVTSSGEAASESNAPGTDASVQAIPGLKLFLDMKPSTLLDSSYAPTPNIGDNARYMYNNSGADQTMVFAGYGDFQVSTFGTNNGRGISSQHSWQYAIDSSQPNSYTGQDFTICWTMKHTQSASGGDIVFNFFSFRA